MQGNVIPALTAGGIALIGGGGIIDDSGGLAGGQARRRGLNHYVRSPEPERRTRAYRMFRNRIAITTGHPADLVEVFPPPRGGIDQGSRETLDGAVNRQNRIDPREGPDDTVPGMTFVERLAPERISGYPRRWLCG